MDDDWDLHAVVRSCTAAASSTSPTPPPPIPHQDSNFSLQDLFQPTTDTFLQDLHDLYKPFCPTSQQPPQMVLSPPQPLPIPSPLSVLGGLQDLPSEPKQQPLMLGSGLKLTASHNPTPRTKRRKSHLKRVCHVVAENLSNDMWSWRKYGQKPIKGSPFPRGYYRCSTSKGCMARKQVERNRSDPGMFIVTYTAEHNHPMPTHRNSLAGSTRPKAAEVPNPGDEANKLPAYSPEMSPASSLSPAVEKVESSREDLPEDDDDFSVSNMALDDDFFEGLEDFTAAPGGGDCTSGHFPANVLFPWLSSSATSTTTAGGR